MSPTVVKSLTSSAICSILRVLSSDWGGKTGAVSGESFWGNTRHPHRPQGYYIFIPPLTWSDPGKYVFLWVLTFLGHIRDDVTTQLKGLISIRLSMQRGSILYVWETGESRREQQEGINEETIRAERDKRDKANGKIHRIRQTWRGKLLH